MKSNTNFLSAVVLSLTSAVAVAPAYAESRAINEALDDARALAGDDQYLKQTFTLQCQVPGDDGKQIDVRNFQFNTEIIPPTKLFDNLFYIGGNHTGSFLFTTPDGYIMVDAGFGNGPEEIILPSLKQLGLDPAMLKYIVITHPGPDHLGGAKYFQDNFGTQVLMSEKDWNNIENASESSWVNGHLPGREPIKFWQGPPQRDLVGADGMTLSLGETKVTMVATPRSTRGGALSYIFPVTDNGEPHVWATYGATGEPRNPKNDFPIYQASVKHLAEVADQLGVDVIISNHPFVDGSVRRMEELKNRKESEPNPFVIGKDGVSRYLGVLGGCADVWVARHAAGLDSRGNPIEAK